MKTRSEFSSILALRVAWTEDYERRGEYVALVNRANRAPGGKEIFEVEAEPKSTSDLSTCSRLETLGATHGGILNAPS